jgi:hypothetical protein
MSKFFFCVTLSADSAFLHVSNKMTVRLKKETQTMVCMRIMDLNKAGACMRLRAKKTLFARFFHFEYNHWII